MSTAHICCGLCVAFHPRPDAPALANPAETPGTCRRHAPSASPIMMMERSLREASLVPTPRVMTCWPTVKANEGCLEFVQQGDKAPAEH